MQHHFFKALASQPNLQYLLVKAVCIGERAMEGLPVLLFQAEKGYVEVFFSREGTAVLGSREFTAMEDLDPYLEEIALPSFI